MYSLVSICGEGARHGINNQSGAACRTAQRGSMLDSSGGRHRRHAAHQLNGTARPRILRATASRVVLPQPTLHVRRHSAIQRGIGASEQVDIPHGFPSCEAPCNGLIPLKNMVLSGCSEPAPPGCPKRGASRTPPKKRKRARFFPDSFCTRRGDAPDGLSECRTR